MEFWTETSKFRTSNRLFAVTKLNNLAHLFINLGPYEQYIETTVSHLKIVVKMHQKDADIELHVELNAPQAQ